jgi:hypothetical protein
LREVGTFVSTVPRSATGSVGAAVGSGALVDVLGDGFVGGVAGVVVGPAVGLDDVDVDGIDGSTVRVAVVGAAVGSGEVGRGRSGAPPLHAASTSSAVTADNDPHVLTPPCSTWQARRGRGQGPRGRWAA